MLTDFDRKTVQAKEVDEHELKFKHYVAMLEKIYESAVRNIAGTLKNPIPRAVLRKNINSLDLAWHCEPDSSFVWKALLKQIKDYIPYYDDLEVEISAEIQRAGGNERKLKPNNF